MQFLIRWLAAVSSAVLLLALWAAGELGLLHRVVLGCWLLIAGYLQFFAESPAMTTVGLVLQTGLAIYLALRAKLVL
jgi:hypothetical protein